MDGRLRYAGRAAGYCRIRSKTMEASNTFPRVDADVAESIADLQRRSRAAQPDYTGMGQAAMDDAVAEAGVGSADRARKFKVCGNKGLAWTGGCGMPVARRAIAE